MDTVFEGQEDLVEQLLEAVRSDDFDRMYELNSQIRWSAESMAHKKLVIGADGIRRMNYNTELADEAYGSDWLDR